MWTFKPPKAYEIDDWDSPKTRLHTVVERKLDGVRAIVHCLEDGTVKITSRRINKDGEYSPLEDKLPHLRDSETLKNLGLRGYTILDGELTAQVDRDVLQHTMSIVGSSSEKAIARQLESGNLVLNVFDTAMWYGEEVYNLELLQRKRFLTFDEEFIKAVPWETLHSQNARRAKVEEFIAAGFEGAILKHPRSEYFSGLAWIKVKESTTVDAQVTGWIKGAGKFEGSLGSLVCCVTNEDGDLVKCCSVSPGTDEKRAELYTQLYLLTEDQIKGLTLIVELEAQGWSTQGGLRHPRILRWRPDRSEPNRVRFDGSRTALVD